VATPIHRLASVAREITLVRATPPKRPGAGFVLEGGMDGLVEDHDVGFDRVETPLSKLLTEFGPERSTT
jgi:hypothetical protein